MITTEFRQEYANPLKASAQSRPSRRSRMETFCDILTAVSQGSVKPTHIMYKANLSWVVMQEYVRSLEKQGLLASSWEQGKLLYHVTEKGHILLREFATLKEELKLSSHQ